MAEVWTPPAFDDVTTSELVTAAYLNGLGNSLRFLKEVNYTPFTADVSVTATTVGTANQIVSSGAITYENVPHLIEFYCPLYSAPATTTQVILRDSTTVVGTLATIAASTTQGALYIAHRRTPTAASHTYNVASWLAAAGTGTMNAGTEGTTGDGSTHVAGYIRITRIPT